MLLFHYLFDDNMDNVEQKDNVFDDNEETYTNNSETAAAIHTYFQRLWTLFLMDYGYRINL